MPPRNTNNPYRLPRTHHTCEDVLRKQYPNLKVYNLPRATTRALEQLMDREIPNSLDRAYASKNGAPTGITYRNLFRIFSGYDGKASRDQQRTRHDRHNRDTPLIPYLVMLKGGCVRDIVQGKPIQDIHDIDMVHTMQFSQALRGVPYGLWANHVQCSSMQNRPGFKYIKVGQDPSPNDKNAVQPVECTESRPLPASDHYEVPANTLMINVGYYVDRGDRVRMKMELDRVYDITGMGWNHAKQRLWTPSDDQLLDNSYWLRNAKLWRMLKFIRRGYTVPDATRAAIYRYWLNKYADETIFPDFIWSNPWAKHFGTKEPLPDGTLPKMADAVHHALRVIFDIVGTDFDRLQDAKGVAFGANAAVAWLKMFVTKGLLTAPAQFTMMRNKAEQQRQAAYSPRRRHPGTGTAKATRSTRRPPRSTRRTKGGSRSKATSTRTTRSRVVPAPVSTHKSTAVSRRPRSRCISKRSRSSSIVRETLKNNSDVVRMFQHLRQFAKAPGCTAKAVFAHARYLIDIRMLTTYPITTWGSHKVVDRAHKSDWLTFPKIGRKTSGQTSGRAGEPRRGPTNTYEIRKSDLHQQLAVRVAPLVAWWAKVRAKWGVTTTTPNKTTQKNRSSSSGSESGTTARSTGPRLFVCNPFVSTLVNRSAIPNPSAPVDVVVVGGCRADVLAACKRANVTVTVTEAVSGDATPTDTTPTDAFVFDAADGCKCRGRATRVLQPSDGLLIDIADVKRLTLLDMSVDGAAMKDACTATPPRAALAPPVAPTFRFVTWNCLSAFPQHYDYYPDTHATGASTPASALLPTIDLTTSIANNQTRHQAIVETLTPVLQRMVQPMGRSASTPPPLDAITLQEVDHALKCRLEDVVRKQFPTLTVFVPKHPYLGAPPQHKRLPVDPVNSNAPHYDYAYWLVTIVRTSDMRPAAREQCGRLPYGRFLVTRLLKCTIINIHAQWISDTHPQYESRSAKSSRLVQQLAGLIQPRASERNGHTRYIPPGFMLGDLNASCPLNQKLYDQYLPAPAFHRVTFGESYKLDSEHIGTRKTFRGIDTLGEDDGCVCGSDWAVQQVDTETLGTKTLPVDAKGLFVAFGGNDVGRWPSDHALVEVCVGKVVTGV